MLTLIDSMKLRANDEDYRVFVVKKMDSRILLKLKYLMAQNFSSNGKNLNISPVNQCGLSLRKSRTVYLGSDFNTLVKPGDLLQSNDDVHCSPKVNL